MQRKKCQDCYTQKKKNFKYNVSNSKNTNFIIEKLQEKPPKNPKPPLYNMIFLERKEHFEKTDMEKVSEKHETQNLKKLLTEKLEKNKKLVELKRSENNEKKTKMWFEYASKSTKNANVYIQKLNETLWKVVVMRSIAPGGEVVIIDEDLDAKQCHPSDNLKIETDLEDNAEKKFKNPSSLTNNDSFSINITSSNRKKIKNKDDENEKLNTNASRKKTSFKENYLATKKLSGLCKQPLLNSSSESQSFITKENDEGIKKNYFKFQLGLTQLSFKKIFFFWYKNAVLLMLWIHHQKFPNRLPMQQVWQSVFLFLLQR